MLRAQQELPVKGDWFSDVKTTLQQMGIHLTIEEIRHMKRTDFRKISKTACEKIALSDLKQKQEKGSKGRNIHYEDKFMMADYLCPNNQLSVEDQRIVFQIRSRTNPIQANIGKTQLCPTGCGNFLENPHILSCEILNPESKFDMNNLLNGSLNEIRISLIQWKENMKKIERIYSMDSFIEC